jgi:hypothetical protein
MKTTRPQGRAFGLRNLMFLLLLSLAACSSSPEERYGKLKAAIEADDFEGFTSYFTFDSNAAIRDMLANGTRSKIPYIKDWKKLVPVAEVEEVDIRGRVAFVKLAGKGKQEIRMLLEHDEWCVDLLGLPAYWQPLKGETP